MFRTPWHFNKHDKKQRNILFFDLAFYGNAYYQRL